MPLGPALEGEGCIVIAHKYRGFTVTTRTYSSEDGFILAFFMYSGHGPAWKVGGPHFCTDQYATVEEAHAGAFRTASTLIDTLIEHAEAPSVDKDFSNDGDVEVWYRKRLGTPAEAVMAGLEIQDAFNGFFVREGFPIAAAVFSRFDFSTRTITAYFSAAAGALARQFGAEPCEKPLRAGLELLAGDDRCWEALFPQSA